MFGIGKKSGVTLDAKKLAQLEDQQLYLLFTEDNWARLNKASRLAALQEVENRRARLDGRPPIRIVEGNMRDFEDEGLAGIHSSNHVIYINYRFLEGNSPYHTPFRALDTVLHEGRHEYQQFVYEQHPELVTPEVVCEWLSSCAHYFKGPDKNTPEGEPWDFEYTKYQMQGIEIDARRFARAEMLRVYEMMQAQGADTRALKAAILENINEEYRFIRRVQLLMTPERIDAIEKTVLDAMRERFPQLNVSNLSLFTHARWILQLPPIDTLDNPVQMVDLLDELEQQRLDCVNDKVDEKLDAFIRESEAGKSERGLNHIRKNRLS